MNPRTYLLAAIGATLDAFCAFMLYRLGFTAIAAFMAVVAGAMYVLAVVLWRRAG